MSTAKPAWRLPYWLVAVLGLAVIAFACTELGRSLQCAVASHDGDCGWDATSAFGGHLNGALFDRINLFAGRVPAIDWAMEAAARYMVYAIVGIAGLSWFVRTSGARERRLALYTAALSMVLALGAALVIQHVYAHPRPFVLRHDTVLLIHHSADPSFPSEHATGAFAIAAGIAMYRARLGIVLLALASVMSFARVYTGLHYPADVAAGALLGIGAAAAVWCARDALAWIDANIVLRLLPRRLA